jgi:hypothetical protein
MTRRLVHDEQGVALVLALMTMLALSILTGAAAVVVSINQHESLHSADARRAFGIAESCLADAEGNVYGAVADRPNNPDAAPATGKVACDGDGGTGLFWANINGDGVTWTMWGQGTYNGTERTVHAEANVPSPVTVQQTGVWNYLYADQKSTDGTCDTTIGGSTTVSVPTFVRGNLCLQSKFTGSQLGVGGNLTLGSQGSSHGGVGSSGAPISSLAVSGSCNGVTTGTGTCNGKTSPIYATSVSSALSLTPQLPALDLSSKYTAANPGPASGHGCQVGSGVPTNFFDNDTTLNHSDGTINLFPGTNYDCVNGSNEIKWCATVNAAAGCTAANTLTVNGMFFFDGNLSLSGNTDILYNGLGTIYVSGKISTSGNFSLCAVSSCNATWDTSQSELVLLAGCWSNSTGSTLYSNYCVDYSGTNVMQVGTYSTNDYHISGNSTNWGPVLAKTLTLNGNLSELVPFKVMPPGTPTNTSTSFLPASAPTYWSG